MNRPGFAIRNTWRWVAALAAAALAAGGGAVAATSAFAATRSAAVRVAQNSCPPSDLVVRKSTRRGVKRRLVPAGPRTALVCRYGAYGPAGGRLLAQTYIASASAVRQLAREFDALPKIPPGTTACPKDNGKAIVSYFRYAKGDDVPVDLHTSGCAYATNGYIERDAMKSPGPRLIGQLERLTPRHHSRRSPALAG